MNLVTSNFIFQPIVLKPPSTRTPSVSLRFFHSNPRQFKTTLCCLSSDGQLVRPTGEEGPASTGSEQLRVVLAAGGTGSHIIPAVAIADELKTARPNTQFLFVGAPNSMESNSVSSAGYPFASIPPVRLFRPVFSLKNISLPFHLVQSTFHCLSLLKKFEPHLVIGTGGYVSFPTCLAALIRRTRVVIQEPNSVPGLANYLASFFAEAVFVPYNSTVECFPDKHKCVVSGNPIRLSLRQLADKATAKREFFGDREGLETAKVILVLGGSLGAHSINIALLNAYSQLLSEHKDWYIIWQAGVEAYNEMESLVRDHSQLFLAPFLQSMDLAYAAADLVVSRAGAMTCSEILAMGKPAILIPSPDISEGHQFNNASLMADLAGTRVVTEDELDSTTLRSVIEEILGDESLMAGMSERAVRAAKHDASAEIARHILTMLDSSTVKKLQ